MLALTVSIPRTFHSYANSAGSVLHFYLGKIASGVCLPREDLPPCETDQQCSEGEICEANVCIVVTAGGCHQQGRYRQHQETYRVRSAHGSPSNAWVVQSGTIPSGSGYVVPALAIPLDGRGKTEN